MIFSAIRQCCTEAANCTEAFIETIVRNRFCHTFNENGVYRQYDDEHLDGWSVDEGYHSTARADAYPYRALAAGPNFGLSLVLRTDRRRKDDRCTMMDNFLLEFRMPYESPQFTNNYFFIGMGDSANLIVTPQVMMTAEELHSYSATKRNCYFGGEKRLHYFKQYTQSNCQNECEAVAIYERCACLPIYIEKKGGNNTCGPATIGCMRLAIQSLFTKNFVHCKCLPACASISYISEVSKTALNKSNFGNFVVKDQEEYLDYAKVNIYFKENHFLSPQRTELYGAIDFLANCGGLLGVCLGVSVLSVLEVIFFCTIRLCFEREAINDQTNSDGVQHGQPQTNKRYLMVTKDLINDYFNQTTIQGIKYAVNSGLSVIERVWWTVVVLISILCCGLTVADVYRRYDQSPVTISYANEETPISEIPYPAITICPQYISMYLEDMYAFYKARNFSVYELGYRMINAGVAAAQVCESDAFDALDPENTTDCDYCADNLKVMMRDAKDVIMACQHIREYTNCNGMFKPLVTEEGVCFVYNNLEVFRDPAGDDNANATTEEWTLEGGYRTHTDKIDIYPRAGSQLPMQAHYRANRRQSDGLCKGATQGFKIYLHLPNEVPLVSKNYHLWPFYHYTQIFVIPRMIVTVPELRDFSIAKRQCYFSDERYLRFFRHYTQNNCESECLVNLTLARCGCLMFHMPKIPGVEFCALRDKWCTRSVIHEHAIRNIDANQLSDCSCLPTCTSISYDTEISHLHLPVVYRGAGLAISFKEIRFIAFERSLLFGTTEFLANIFGLMGLFLGFSLISLLELLYFCTIRLVCNLRL